MIWIAIFFLSTLTLVFGGGAILMMAHFVETSFDYRRDGDRVGAAVCWVLAGTVIIGGLMLAGATGRLAVALGQAAHG